MTKEYKISLFALILVMGFSIAVFFHYIQGNYTGRAYPYNTFLFNPKFALTDFFYTVTGSEHLDPYNLTSLLDGYFPFAHLLAYVLSLIHPYILAWGLFMMVYLTAFVSFAWLFLYPGERKLSPPHALNLFILTVLSYPMIFALDRSNFDLMICILLFCYAAAYLRQKTILSAVFLAMATAMKPFVGVLIFIYLKKKQWKEAAWLTANTAFLTIISLALFKDGLVKEVSKFIASLHVVSQWINTGAIFHFSSDLYNAIALLLQMRTQQNWLGNPILDRSYSLFAGISFVICLFLISKKAFPFWKLLSIFTVLSILLSFTSVDYRLTYLFAPLFLFLSQEEPSRWDKATVILWGLLFIPKNYYTLAGDQNIGMLINPLLLLGMLIFLFLDGERPARVPIDPPQAELQQLAGVS